MKEKEKRQISIEEMQKDTKEFLDLLNQLTDGDKREIKGMMIGMQTVRRLAAQSA